MDFRYIKSFKLVVHGGWGVDDIGNLVITWRWWGWEKKKRVIFGKKKNIWWHFRELYELVEWLGQKKNTKKTWVSFMFDFEFWVNFAKIPTKFPYFRNNY